MTAASCTTNCLAPVVKVGCAPCVHLSPFQASVLAGRCPTWPHLTCSPHHHAHTHATLLLQVVHEKLKIKHGCITTIHNLTNTQVRWLGGAGVSRGESYQLACEPCLGGTRVQCTAACEPGACSLLTAARLAAALQTLVDAPNSKKSDLRRARWVGVRARGA